MKSFFVQCRSQQNVSSLFSSQVSLFHVTFHCFFQESYSYIHDPVIEENYKTFMKNPVCDIDISQISCLISYLIGKSLENIF